MNDLDSHDTELLKEENQAVSEEIQKYKWIESEKAGYDIGVYRAAIEWVNKYYDGWKEHWLRTHSHLVDVSKSRKASNQ